MRFFPAILLVGSLSVCSCDRQPLTVSQPDDNDRITIGTFTLSQKQLENHANPFHDPAIPFWITASARFVLWDDEDGSGLVYHSAGPPPKVNYLIRAARLECLATMLKHYETISQDEKNPLKNSNTVHAEFQQALELYQEYDRRYNDNYYRKFADYKLAGQLRDLNNFLATGYQGELLPEFQKLRAELKRKL